MKNKMGLKNENNLDENGKIVLDGFLNEYYDELLGYARHYLGGRHHDAEEVLGNVALNLFANGKANLYNSTMGKLRPWLYTAVNNACIDFKRSERRHSRYLHLDEDYGKGPRRNLSKNFLEDPSAEDPREVFLRQEVEEENTRIIDLAISKLPEDLREVVKPFYLEDMSCREVAEMLETPLGTVKSKLHRARKSLKGLFSPEPSSYLHLERYKAVA